MDVTVNQLFSLARNFCEVRASLVVANISCCEPYVYGFYNHTGLDKAWSRTLVFANQFIGR